MVAAVEGAYEASLYLPSVIYFLSPEHTYRLPVVGRHIDRLAQADDLSMEKFLVVVDEIGEPREVRFVP